MTRSRLTEERALSSRQLMLVHSKMLRWLARPLLPKGWTAGGFKTSGDVEAQRVSLETLGNRLAGLGIFSFLCKCVSSATSYFARDIATASGNFEAIMFLATTLTVQAIPSVVTLMLLSRFHFSGGGGGGSNGTIMQSLLSREDDDQLYERFMLIEEIEDMLAALFRQFMELRLDDELWRPEIQAIRTWVHEVEPG